MLRHLVIGLGLIAVVCPMGLAADACSKPAANPLGVRIFSYGKFQEDAWKHLPAIGVRNVFLSVPPADQAAALKKKLADAKLKAPVMRGETDWTKPTAAQQLGTQLAIAKDLGARYIFLSVKHPGVEKPVVYQRLREAGDVAKKYGLILVLETHPDLGTNSDEHIATMKAVDHPNVRVNFDTGNITFYNTGRDAVSELKKVLPWLATVEIKDHNGQLQTWNFPPLGRGTVDIPGVLKVLGAHGYKGPISLEIEGITGVEKTRDQTLKDIADSVKYVRSLRTFE
jgi:sugar phosphate isomerase/epimerase